MPAVELAISNGRVVAPGGEFEGGLAIDHGRIVALGADSSLPDARTILDAEGAYILPGAIDPHVHFREPGLTDREDFGTGTSAAAAGGVTTVFEMPNTDPPTWSGKLVLEKRALVEPKALVDFGLFGIVGQENLSEIGGMADAGVIGFKLYLHQSMGHLSPPDDNDLLEAFERIAETGRPAAVHAENPVIIDRRRQAFKTADRHDASAYLSAHPSVSESEMVERCIHFAQVAGVRLHVCHVSSADTVEVVAAAKQRGQAVTAETGPQWLSFTSDDIDERGTILLFSPPFRQAADRDALWVGLATGAIDMLASDHSPRHDHEKLCSSVWDAKSGFAGVETSVAVVASGVVDGKLEMGRFAEVMAGNAAEAFGLANEKGALRVGAIADVVVLQTQVDGIINSEELHSRARATPFAGYRVSARIRHTVARGRPVLVDGSVVPKTGGRDVCFSG